MSKNRKKANTDSAAEEFRKKLYAFAELFERNHNDRRERLYPGSPIQEVGVEESGYKFRKVFICDGSRSGRYMVELETGNIYGVKSWTQVNLRRMYGTLDTADQFDWSEEQARPMPGTPVEHEFYSREAEIQAGYKKRGRKKNSEKLVAAGVKIPKGIFT